MDTAIVPSRVPTNPTRTLAAVLTLGREALLVGKSRTYIYIYPTEQLHLFPLGPRTIDSHIHQNTHSHLSIYTYTHTHSAPTFTCPQQPNLHIPFSRLYDGICDCCDGADEPLDVVPCPDVCQQVMAQERAARAAAAQHFITGSAYRQEQVAAFAAVTLQAAADLEKSKADVFFVEQSLQQTVQAVTKWKVNALDDRLDRALGLTVAFATVENTRAVFDTQDSVRGLFEPLTSQELAWWIVHACQLAGEMEADGKQLTACVPLRLAGLDASVWWQAGGYELQRVAENDTENKEILAHMLEHNLVNDRKVWNPDMLKKGTSGGGNHRRLMEEDMDEDMYNDDMMMENDDDLGDDYDDMYPDMGDLSEEGQEEEPDEEGIADEAPEKDNESRKKREELKELIKSRSFTQSRLSFLERSSEVVGKITQLLMDVPEKVDDEEEGEEKEGESEEIEATSDSLPPQVDPMALPMVKSTLGKRVKQVKRGLDYAVSAKNLLDVVEASVDTPERHRAILNQLAVGVLNHGQLSAVHVWQIMQAIVPELASSQAKESVDPQTCQSPWAGLCPPISVMRKEAQVPLPVEAIFKAAQAFCDSEGGAPPAGGCAADTGDELPTEIADGYYGYYEVKPRGDDDIFAHVFKDLSLDEDTEARAELYEADKEVKRLEDDREEHEKSMKELNDLIESKETNKYGLDGELYGLRDTCHSVVAGKYVYELCLFGAARQKDVGVEQGGTGLGNWIGAEVEEETGRRIWKWGNGAKCWNGPQRSSTAYVTCGAETKVHTADEPDTCRYVLQVESPVACDERYRLEHNLPSSS